MVTIKGKSVFGGIAMGKIRLYSQKEEKVKREKILNIENEIKRFESAREEAILELSKLYEDAISEVGEANATIFSIHSMMLEDTDYIDSVKNIIESEEVNAEYAVGITSDNFSEMFRSMDDSYMKERASDVKDISDRLIRTLLGKDEEIEDMEPGIVAADDLLPSQTVQMDKSKVLAFLTSKGSVNSHTAILARTMNIPAIVGIKMPLDEFDKKFAVVDGFSGTVYIEPDEETLINMRQKKEKDEEKKALLEKLKGKESITKDGKRIEVYANIGGPGDCLDVLMNDADGVGLFRSEFLYLETNDYPTEDEQFLAYKKVVQNMAGKKVIIRTLDVGADKKIDYFGLGQEENPAMGYRAVRICLDRPDIFKTQLRAILRASAFGDVSLMVPMITSLDEVKRIKTIINNVKIELRGENIPFDESMEVGIMIETPAACIISDKLAKEVDFFSIGTNDLVQYTLAADRQNPMVEDIYTHYHEACLKLIELTAQNANKEGIWVGVCGEAAADLNLTEFFVRLGVKELSVSPPNILLLRERIRGIDSRVIGSGYPKPSGNHHGL